MLVGSIGAGALPPRPDQGVVVLARVGTHTLGLLVDGVVGRQQVVIKNLGEAIGEVQGVTGGAVMADGEVAHVGLAQALAGAGIRSLDSRLPAEAEEDDEPFEEKVERLTAELREQMTQAANHVHCVHMCGQKNRGRTSSSSSRPVTWSGRERSKNCVKD